MARHGFVGFMGAPKQTVDAFQAQYVREGRRIDRLFADETCTVFGLGEEGSVLQSWSDGRRFAVAFGSAASFLSPESPSPLLDPILERGSISSELSDLVALIVEDGAVNAITGNGAHRLFRRELPAGGSVVSTSLILAARVDCPAPVDRSYEDFFLGFGFFPDRKTMFEGVIQLPSSSTCRLVNGETRDVQIEATKSDLNDMRGDLIDHLLAATERQSKNVGHCAVFLGGLDSALVCALLRKLGKRVTAYTFDFGQARFNQTHTDTVASFLGIERRLVRIDVDRMRTGIRNLPNTLNSPGAQPHYQLHTVFAAEDMQNDGLTTAFTGDGCDALFLGYPTVRARSTLISRLRNMPGYAMRGAIGLLSLGWSEYRLGHIARTARSVLRASMLDYPASGHLPTQYLDAVSLTQLRPTDTPTQQEPVNEIRTRLASGLEDTDPTRLAFLGNAATGASRIKVDGAIMQAGVGQFTPFKDPAVVNFVSSLPRSALLPDGSTRHDLGKRHLIDSVLDSGLLPEEVVLQPKQSPVSSPIDYWYMSELRSDVLELLESLPFEWNRDYVENLLRPKSAEEWYRKRIALSPHALQAVGLLVSYASFSRIAN